jgi:hypothetical protein
MTITLLADAAAVVGSLSIILGAIIGIVRWSVWKITKIVRTEIGDQLRNIRINTNQLLPNGGTHLADTIRKLEVNQSKACTEIQALRLSMQEHLADHRVG